MFDEPEGSDLPWILTIELPNIPLSPYGASKICAEKYVQAFSNSKINYKYNNQS